MALGQRLNLRTGISGKGTGKHHVTPTQKPRFLFIIHRSDPLIQEFLQILPFAFVGKIPSDAAGHYLSHVPNGKKLLL